MADRTESRLERIESTEGYFQTRKGLTIIDIPEPSPNLFINPELVEGVERDAPKNSDAYLVHDPIVDVGPEGVRRILYPVTYYNKIPANSLQTV